LITEKMQTSERGTIRRQGVIPILLLLFSAYDLFAEKPTLKSLYTTQKYEACFEKAHDSNAFEDITTQSYLSLCAEKSGHDTIAIAALERILFLRPDDVDAMLRLGKIYQRLGLLQQQTLLTDSLVSYQLTPEQRTTLATLVAKEEPSLSKISARVTLGAGYDSDLNILPTRDVVASSYLRFAASASLVHELESPGGWFINAALQYQHQSNEAEQLYNMDFVDSRVGIGYRLDTMTVSLPLYYRRLRYLDSDLLHEYGVAPKVDMMLSKSMIVTVEAQLAKRDFLLESYRPKDFDLYGGSLSGVWLSGPDFLFVKGAFKNIRQSNDLPDLFTAKETYSLIAGGYYRLNSALGTRMNYRYRDSDFTDYARRDRNHALLLALEWTVSTHWRLVGTFKNIVNLSDFDAAYYRKQVSELALQYDY